MTTWLFRRLLQAAMVVLAMTIIVFVGLHVVGDPVTTFAPPEATQADLARIRENLGLDRPFALQYVSFLSDLVRGDLGTSYVYGVPALELVLSRMPATFELAATAMAISIVIGIGLGIYCGLYPEKSVSRAIMAGSIFGFSLPTFWVGIMLIMLFSVELGWLPSGGRGETVTVLGLRWSFLTWDGLAHLLLPAINLALFKMSLLLRLTRAIVRETLPKDYVKFARAKGLPERRVLGVHVLKNIMIPIVTIIGLELGSVVAFAVVTETVFAWPGMGKLIIDSIQILDRPVILAYLIIIVLMFVVLNLIVDILYAVLDPRVRQGMMS
ncbi:ABC transporter permease [Roseitranquillus sediminis]|uniref:ABC transporter permease n=1 Tax=Roseitranquillus sediminis TaxID=2809051 RepID=UPI001D0C01CE|nr:ABC transporter permease [Roseitranquillus sediminis]MBM9594717.1 ABC transporter permease [Roseitranquillus sediminis]